ncbi:mitogen-activated protein kinase kinase kinase 15 [Galendromus occidentalis]|uniref:mitogen-activated protein kinase kinase kinase n=1 Tax=Galendromus occidentalis TaxID=34638 RepID=A0AAJ7SFB8_9ACAR|nr:mitogen-activated protein kinase kinase kinase 15 [Galendromus occidentalis]
MLKRKCRSQDNLVEAAGHAAKRPSVTAFNVTPNSGLPAASSSATAQMDPDLPPSQGSSTTTTVAKMEVVLLIDLETRHSEWGDPQHRAIALEEIRKASRCAGAEFKTCDLKDLAYHEGFSGSGDAREQFYQADVAIVDVSVRSQWNVLFYHLGIRESFGMSQSILIGNASSKTGDHKSQLFSYKPVYYRVTEKNFCYVSDIGPFHDSITSSNEKSLTEVIRKSLLELEVQTKEFLKDRFLKDLRHLPETLRGDELRAALKNFRIRLDDPNVISLEVVHALLNALNDAQDYDSSVKLVEDLQEVSTLSFMHCAAIQYLYAFALNRRKKEGDTDRALAVMEKALEKKENEIPDYLGLCGRIYKDKYLNSDCKDTDSLKKAIEWYRKGFDALQSVYNGINLATLLTADGHRSEESHDLQYVFLVLNNLIGKKGEIDAMTDYWDVATYFEVCYLVEDYTRAIKVAIKMFHLNPASWCLASTLLNIQLIARKRRKGDTTEIKPEEHIMGFWIDYFSMATQKDLEDHILFPVLINEPTETLMPSYVTLNLDTGDQKKSIQISHKCVDTMRGTCKRRHEWLFTSPTIKGVSLYKQDDRCILLYVHENSDDFQMFFPSSAARGRFYQVVQGMINENQQNEDAMCLAFDYDAQFQCIDFEYELDENRQKKVLGKGTYGVVYAATDTKTMTQIAVKEIHEKNLKDVQPLHEEIMLHMHLRHKNIVQYLGSKSEDGFVKICMERVPGGSLSHLLRFNWGPLRFESTIAHYTKQILEGIKYLHKNNIVHRDIKGDNVLINTYSGIVKISDFGTSKRMVSGRLVETFAGTFQYMAPEVMDNGDRGYGKPADIWSLGCTIIEMATGKYPFPNLPPQAALFKVGQFKIHPDIPEKMSDIAKNFIEKCFDPDPDKRATADDLLVDPFLNAPERKKRQRPTGPPIEIPRSMSVPYPGHTGGRVSRFSSTGEDGAYRVAASPTSEGLPRSPGAYSYRTRSCLCSSRGVDPQTPLTPSMSSTFNWNLVATGANSALISPPVDGGPQNGVEEGQEFYMLKKDSQRRQTIVKVLQDDGEQILKIWMDKIQANLGSSALLINEEHLTKLLSGMISFLPEQNKNQLSKVLAQLKESLDYDGSALNQLQTALFVFQHSVMDILKRQNIKPHWMFALDNLVKQCCQAAISILSPELAANIIGHNIEEEEDRASSVTSGVSTTASIRSAQKQDGLSHMDGDVLGRVLDQFGNLPVNKEDTTNLVKALMEQEMRCCGLVLSLIKNGQMGADGSSSTSRLLAKDDGDPEMVRWLENIGLDEASVMKFVQERFSMEDVLQLVDREDLKRLGLKLGYEVRVWTAIQKHRNRKDCENTT